MVIGDWNFLRLFILGTRDNINSVALYHTCFFVLFFIRPLYGINVF